MIANPINETKRTTGKGAIKKALEREFNHNWTEQFRSEKKMRTYTEFKTRFIFENYLNTTVPNTAQKSNG